MKKSLLMLFVMAMLVCVPVDARAESESDKEFSIQVKMDYLRIISQFEEGVDWKTVIPIDLDPGYLFKYEYEEPKTMYATTGVNLRTSPNIESEVKEVLKRNDAVLVVADYKGWSKVVCEDGYFYVWNEYLSGEKQNDTYLGKFKLTAYCNCRKCCGQWAYGPTASGTMPKEGRTVAMGGVKFGTKLLINGKEYIVEDRGTPYGHVDIYFADHDDTDPFGVRYAKVYLIED